MLPGLAIGVIYSAVNIIYDENIKFLKHVEIVMISIDLKKSQFQ